MEHKSRPVARKPCDAAAVFLRLKFADGDKIHYKFKSSQSSTAWLLSSKHTSGKQVFNAKYIFKIAKLLKVVLL